MDLLPATRLRCTCSQGVAGQISRELGQQLDDVHEQIASARVELKAANEQAKQIIANAQSEAAAIKRAADKQAEDIIQTARAKIEKAHAHLGV